MVNGRRARGETRSSAETKRGPRGAARQRIKAVGPPADAGRADRGDPRGARLRGRSRDDEAEREQRPGPVFRRALSARVPVWILLVSLLSVAGVLVVLLLTQSRSAGQLAPAVGAAQRVHVEMTLCNADVDRLEINPRTSELELEGALRSEGARMADVVVHREDCPRSPQP